TSGGVSSLGRGDGLLIRPFSQASADRLNLSLIGEAGRCVLAGHVARHLGWPQPRHAADRDPGPGGPRACRRPGLANGTPVFAGGTTAPRECANEFKQPLRSMPVNLDELAAAFHDAAF